MSLSPDATVLGFDVGARRIGVALGSGYGLGARVLAVVDVHADRVDWAAIDRLHREWRPAGFIVGDPMTMDGGDQPIRQRARAFAAALRARFGLPVAMIDERNTSQEAARRFAAERAEGRRKRRDAASLDAVAATIILERWLTAPHEAKYVEAVSLEERPQAPPEVQNDSKPESKPEPQPAPSLSADPTPP
jgi:putative Holliday junction resolvase